MKNKLKILGELKFCGHFPLAILNRKRREWKRWKDHLRHPLFEHYLSTSTAFRLLFTPSDPHLSLYPITHPAPLWTLLPQQAWPFLLISSLHFSICSSSQSRPSSTLQTVYPSEKLPFRLCLSLGSSFHPLNRWIQPYTILFFIVFMIVFNYRRQLKGRNELDPPFHPLNRWFLASPIIFFVVFMILYNYWRQLKGSIELKERNEP